MNFNKFINSDYLKNNPLCGIETYKDELNLATGVCTRKIKKLVLTGEESFWSDDGTIDIRSRYRILTTGADAVLRGNRDDLYCTHFKTDLQYSANSVVIYNGTTGVFIYFYVPTADYTTLADFKTYIQQQYVAGTPVCVWYVLATPTTETITVPSGLFGTEEGYLNQSGTPTPDNPIYPTANTVEKWFDLNHYIMGTSTDTITTLPAVVYADGNNATIGISGNMEQNGTPTPQNPIQPSECGERTGNLFDKDSNTINNNGQIRPGVDVPAGIYSISNGTPNWVYYRVGVQGTTRQISTGSNAENINASDTLYVWRDANIRQDGVMLNTGTTALPYEPYGYKIPISSGDTTTPVYLGEVQTKRNVAKYVLTGEENIDYYSTAQGSLFRRIIGGTIGQEIYGHAICTHYSVTTVAARANNTLSGNASTINTNLDFIDNRYNSAADFKAYLAAQYAAGTPVTVWYVLATPTTGIVNEPLRKIGEYADTVSGITIPTIAGANTLSVGTTLQPSEVTVNYKGWHTGAVHERDSGQWQLINKKVI